MKKVVVGISAFVLLALGVFITIFVLETTAVSRDITPIQFEVKKGETYLTLASRLKDENLIKSEFFYKLYIKLNNPKQVQAGLYELSESMSVSDIVDKFMEGNSYNPDIVTFTIPEGKHLEEIAEIISSKTNHILLY